MLTELLLEAQYWSHVENFCMHFGDTTIPTQMASSPSINREPPFDATEYALLLAAFIYSFAYNRCLPENYGPPLSALAEGKSSSHTSCLPHLNGKRPYCKLEQTYGGRSLHGSSPNKRKLCRRIFVQVPIIGIN